MFLPRFLLFSRDNLAQTALWERISLWQKFFLKKGLTVPIEECTLVNALEEDKTTPNAPNLDKLIV
jgi:hypothetical protein